MLSAEDDERLTRTGRGTPMGELFRRFWMPVLLAREVPAPELRGYIDQLTQGGFLTRMGDQYPTLQISPAGADLLRGQAECVLFRQPRPVKSRQRRQGPRTDASWKGVDQRLFEKLRALRLELARGRGVPPYVIFHDSTLREIASRKPHSLDELSTVQGVGAVKLERYGEAMLLALSANA